MFFRFIFSVLGISILCGCVNVQPILASEAPADITHGYISGQFSRVNLSGFGLVVKEIVSGNEYIIPMGEDTNFPSAINAQTVAVKLQPGTYKVSQWVTYATLTKETIARRSLESSPLSKPFKVNSGSVVHLGSYSLGGNKEISYAGLTMNFRMDPLPVTEIQVYDAFKHTYPKLANLPFHCILCAK